MTDSKGLRFEDTRFWVTHRRCEYGPFDYEWSEDLRGIELHYCGVKFGEVCSVHDLFADMKEFGLPMRVVEVACVVFGSSLLGITGGFSAKERDTLLANNLRQFDCDDFLTDPFDV
ncbi:hypothetical protein OAF98_02265 [Planctomicrobium sp.]|nr:hypothetical protein [Planctomicrobium sp.]MDA7503588.1 hypothetical protein [bacterium]MDB4743286.1 hypothetical protein [Planctomicrobium sp.]